jgi:Glutaminase
MQSGNVLALSPFYTPYIDKTLGKEGQSIEDFKKRNAQQIDQINKSNLLMVERNASEEQSLSLEEVKSLLAKSTEMTKKYIDQIPGPCYLRSTHIVHELNQKYPAVPAMKIWLFGSFYNRTNDKNRWNYHTAAAVPVRSEGKVQWMILDPLVAQAGALSLEEWVRETNKSYRFMSRLKVVFSAVDKIGPYVGATLYKLGYLKNGDSSVYALQKADIAQD